MISVISYLHKFYVSILVCGNSYNLVTINNNYIIGLLTTIVLKIHCI